MSGRLDLIHFAQDDDTSGFFPALAKYHDRSRYRMTFATLRPMAPWLDEFMRAREVDTFSSRATSRLQYPAAIASLTARLRRQRPSLFHAHLFDPSVVGLTAAWLARVPGRILTRHYSNYHTRINRPIHVKLDQWCTARSTRVIGVSRETAEHLVAIEGAPANKVVAIHNGIDFDRVRSSEDARGRLRAELGVGDRFVFLIAGRLHPEKGYEHLLEASRQLKAVGGRPFVVLAAGHGPFLDRYRETARGLGIEDVFHFLGFRRDLPDLMVASDAFVLPSVAESFGLVLAEALYLGVPVIASRVGGIPEIVDDGVDGVLVEPGDAAALARTMSRFLRNEVELPGRGDAAFRKVKERFDFRSMLTKYEAVYRDSLQPLP